MRQEQDLEREKEEVDPSWWMWRVKEEVAESCVGNLFLGWRDWAKARLSFLRFLLVDVVWRGAQRQDRACCSKNIVPLVLETEYDSISIGLLRCLCPTLYRRSHHARNDAQ